MHLKSGQQCNVQFNMQLEHEGPNKLKIYFIFSDNFNCCLFVNRTCMPKELLTKAINANKPCKDAFKACEVEWNMCPSPNHSAPLPTIEPGTKNKDAATRVDKKVDTVLKLFEAATLVICYLNNAKKNCKTFLISGRLC